MHPVQHAFTPQTPVAAHERALLDPLLASAPVLLAIDGRVTSRGRTGVSVNRVRRGMQDTRLVALLLSIFARDRALEAWSSRRALQIGPSRSATTQIRAVFKGLVPDGFQAFEGDGRGSFRLNPEVVIEAIDWDALIVHPNEQVARVALEHRARRGLG